MSKVYRQGKELVEDIHNTNVPMGCVAIWNLGQASVFIKSGPSDEGQELPTIVIDPYLTRSIEENNPGTEFIREYDAPLEAKDLAGVTAVLVTHQHDDHLDLSTISALAKVSPNTRFIIPAPHAHMLREIGIPDEALILARAGQTIEMGGLRILPIAAAHEEYQIANTDEHFYLGYAVSIGEVRIYHSGDTLVTDILVDTVKEYSPHIAILPINGGDYYRTKRGIVRNMTARESVDFAVDIGADILMPNHYDMFPNNRDNPAFLVDYLFHHHRHLKFHMSAVGERFIYFP